MHRIIDIANELGCFFSWVPRSVNQVADELAKQGAKHLTSFVGDFLLLLASNVFSVVWMLVFLLVRLSFCGSSFLVTF